VAGVVAGNEIDKSLADDRENLPKALSHGPPPSGRSRPSRG
jgi:hypothetical protein